MTSTENMAEIDVLKAKAKELGISGWQTFKDPVKLQAKIDDATAGGNVLKKAPKMTVAGIGEDTRATTIADLERKDPDSKYITQSASKSHSEIAAKNLEIMRKPNGDIMYLGNDIICRTDRESYYDWQNGRTEHSLKSMRAIDKDLSSETGGKRIQSLTERPKQGVGSD